MQKTLDELDACEQKVLVTLGAEYAHLMSTHKLILQDPSLKDSVSKKSARSIYPRRPLFS